MAVRSTQVLQVKRAAGFLLLLSPCTVPLLLARFHFCHGAGGHCALLHVFLSVGVSPRGSSFLLFRFHFSSELKKLLPKGAFGHPVPYLGT